MGASLWSFCEIFINTLSRLHLSIMYLQGVLEWMGASIMKLLWNFHQDPISGSLSRHHLSSKLFLPGVLEVIAVSDKHPSEVSVKVSSRSCIRNPVKTPPVLKVYSWILEWHGGSGWTWSWCPISLFLESSRTHSSWWSWRWCQMICIILQKLLWKFYQHLRLGTLSRLLLSSKSLPGVMEDKEVPDERGVGVRY